MFFYSQTTGCVQHQIDLGLEILGYGYAGGKCGEKPYTVNNPTAQDVPETGPLPTGIYTIGAPTNDTKMGPLVLPLEPDPSNIMWGRKGFFIHGDNDAMNQSASEGCIVLDHDLRYLIAEAVANGDNKLVVTRV